MPSAPDPAPDRSDDAVGFARRAAGVLRARSVELRDGDRRRVLATWGSPGRGVVPVARTLDLAEEPSATLCSPVPSGVDVDGDTRALVAVAGERGAAAWLEVVWSGDTTLDPRTAVMLRVLARTAQLLLDRPRSATPLVDRLVLSGAELLAELALTAETFDQLLGGITAVLAPLVDGTSVGVAEMNDEGYLQALPGSFGASAELVASSQVSRTEITTAAAAVFRTGRTMLANDPRTDIPRFVEWVEGFGISRLMTLPMIVGGRPLGVVHVANKPVGFTEADARLAERLTPFVAGAVAHVHQRLELRRRERVTAVLGRAATAIASGVQLSEFAPFLEELRAVLDCRTAVVTFLAEDQPRLVAGRADPAVVRRDVEFLGEVDIGSAGIRSAMSRPQAPGELGWVTLHAPILVDGASRAHLAMLRTPCEPFREPEQAAVRRMADVIALGWTTDRYRWEQAEKARARERERIADDIHDRTVQLLFSGKLTLQRLFEQLDEASPARPTAARALSLLVRSEESIREAIHHLAPSARPGAGLGTGLAAVAEEVGQQFAADIVLAPGCDTGGVDLDIRRTTALLAAAREAMINAAKHAGPCRVRVDLDVTATGGVVLRVADDGVGFPARVTPGYGLDAVRRRLAEHGGCLAVRARPGGGTEVIVSVAP